MTIRTKTPTGCAEEVEELKKIYVGVICITPSFCIYFLCLNCLKEASKVLIFFFTCLSTPVGQGFDHLKDVYRSRYNSVDAELNCIMHIMV